MGTKRSLWLAAALSIVSVGLGHMYSGKLKRGILIAVFSLILGNLVYATILFWDFSPLNILLPITIALGFWALLVIDAWRTARNQSEEFECRSYNGIWHYLLYFLIFFVITWFGLPVIGRYQSFKMPAASMENTLFSGEMFMARLTSNETNMPSRGEILIFLFPVDGTTKFLKRCIGVPGDTIEILDKQLFVNGDPASDPPTVKYIDTKVNGQQLIQPRRPGGLDSRDNFGPYVVPINYYFMMGDSRDNSFDSRYWGPVHKESIIARPHRIYYSKNWKRIGLRLN